MGTTLTNGIYLPNEGEKNCYAGLKTNWETLDQKIADITALQQAVAGALHREIVASLPTTDIDPNTIYMILSGTSATENVYDEFMYVNNAWELIGTSATDLTNYYTKGDVDGLLLLKANASDLTSHTGDTTIHVTTSDKSKWDTVALIKQLRLVNTQVGSATTIAFANIDDTNGIKVGDKCMDLDAKMFEITAVDTTNQTVTVGTALIDLALDANVVHTSGDETINGVKSLINYFLGKDLSGQTVDLNDCVDAYGGAIHYYYAVSNYTNISNKPENKPFILESKTVRYVSSIDYIYYQKIYTGEYNASPSIYTRYYRSGSSSWSNWVKDTDKFVTTDTNQTVSGAKTFLDVPITLQSSTAELGVTGGNTKVVFTDKNLLNLAGITFGNYGSSKLSYCRFHIYDKDSNNQEVENFVEFSYVNNNQIAYFRPNKSNFVTLGTVNNRWSKVYADEYYYGSNSVEFSTKFVTTDTAQTISGAKTFSDNLIIYNSDDTQTPKGLAIKNAQWGMGESGGPTVSNINFLDKNSAITASIIASKGIYGQSFLRLGVRTKDSQNNTYSEEIYYDIDTSGNVEFRSWHNNIISLGTSAYKWKDVQTKLVNGLTPSSLGMPDIANKIDISGYITDLTGVGNEYTPTVNGWICIRSANANKISILDYVTNIGNTTVSNTATYLTVMAPVVANRKVLINIMCTSLEFAYFIPCQGNV